MFNVYIKWQFLYLWYNLEEKHTFFSLLLYYEFSDSEPYEHLPFYQIEFCR